MKTKRISLSGQILIVMMSALLLFFIVEVASAQSTAMLPTAIPTIAQSGNQGNIQNQTTDQAQIIQISMPQKGLGARLLENTSLSYYHQFLGPTAAGRATETYNIFQEAQDLPGTGRAPLQSFHALNLRHQINTDWGIGATLSAVDSYTGAAENRYANGDKFYNRPSTDFFNSRAYVSLPPLKLDTGTLFSTASYEFPTSKGSRTDDMIWGWVLAQSFALNIPSPHWTAGLTAQVYRIYYKNKTLPPPWVGARSTPLQTMVVSGGPYVNYRFNDKWMLGSVITMDWDQRGAQSSSKEFNNNLPHRGRVNLTYFPQKIKYLQSVGLFSQALLKFRPETTAFGADFSVLF